MEETCIQRYLGYYSIEIIRDKEGNPLIIVKFKDEGKGHWAKEHSWCPTSAELEFLYRTMKWMRKRESKIQTQNSPDGTIDS
jgi:hypothetical protein